MTMNRARNFKTISIFIIVFIVMLLIGCADKNQSGLTINEPEITVDYLSGDYARQLLKDEAEYVMGTLEITADEDGVTFLNIQAKELVEDENQPNGFYIADRNMNVKVPLAMEARTTFISGDLSIATVMSAEEFIAAVSEDIAQYGGENNPNYSAGKLYHVYVMNGQAELVLAQYIP